MTIADPTRDLLARSKRVRRAVARARRRGQLGQAFDEVRHDRHRAADERVAIPRFY